MWGFLSLLKELEEANDLVSHILCPREDERVLNRHLEPFTDTLLW